MYYFLYNLTFHLYLKGKNCSGKGIILKLLFILLISFVYLVVEYPLWKHFGKRKRVSYSDAGDYLVLLTITVWFFWGYRYVTLFSLGFMSYRYKLEVRLNLPEGRSMNCLYDYLPEFVFLQLKFLTS